MSHGDPGHWCLLDHQPRAAQREYCRTEADAVEAYETVIAPARERLAAAAELARQIHSQIPNEDLLVYADACELARQAYRAIEQPAHHRFLQQSGDPA